MEIYSLILILLICTLCIIAIVQWRRHYPCPSFLTCLLENPYVKYFASSSTILNRINLASGMTIVDIGCGPGRISIPAASRVGDSGKVVALDIQEKMLKKLRSRMDKFGIKNIQPILGGIGDGLLKPDTCDRAILVTVLGEISDKPRALSEIYKVLKPGGILSITELFPDPHYMAKKKILSLGESQGFSFNKFYGNIISYTINFSKPM